MYILNHVYTINTSTMELTSIHTCFTLDKMLGSAATITDNAFIAFVLTWTAGSFNTFKSCTTTTTTTTTTYTGHTTTTTYIHTHVCMTVCAMYIQKTCSK